MNPGSTYTRAELFNCLLKFDLANLGTSGRLAEFSHFNVDTWHGRLRAEGRIKPNDINKQPFNTFIWTFKSAAAKHTFCGGRGPGSWQRQPAPLKIRKSLASSKVNTPFPPVGLYPEPNPILTGMQDWEGKGTCWLYLNMECQCDLRTCSST